MSARTAAEEIERLLSLDHLGPILTQHRRFVFSHAWFGQEWRFGQEWLEAEEVLWAHWAGQRHADGCAALRPYPDGRTIWARAGIEVRRHHHPRGEALQYCHAGCGAHVVLPMIRMEDFSLLLSGLGSSDRFQEGGP